jgi:PST family polysaccharide transporter
MSFKKDLFVGAAYIGLAKYFNIGISIIVTAILARLLTPNDFGTVAIVTVFINFITLLTGSGMSPAIIQYKELTDDDLSNIYSFTFYCAIFSTIIFVVIAPFIGNFYGDSQLSILCFLLSINIFFSVLNIVPNALLFKNKEFKYVALRTVTVQLVFGLLSVVCALSGLGIYSLIITPIGSSILIFIISYRFYPIPLKIKYSCSSVKKIFSFSTFQLAFNILNFSYRNLDKLLIGKYIGLSILGYYEKSYRLMMMPLENISNVINPVLHPLLSEYQNDKEYIYTKYSKIIQYFSYIGFILTVVCFTCSREIILIFFGSQWDQAIPVFKILSLSIGIQVIQSAVGSVFQSLGKVKYLFYSGVIAFILSVSAIILGVIQNSIESVALYIVIAFYLSFIIYHKVLICDIFKSSLIHFLKTLLLPFFVSVILAIMVFLFDLLYPIDNIVLSLISKLFIIFISFVILQYCGFIQDLPKFSKIISYVRNYKRTCR